MNFYFIIAGILILIFVMKKTTKYNFNFNLYNEELGLSESSGNYSTNTGNGMYGKYQFSYDTLNTVLNELNINVSTSQFLQSPNLQDAAVNQLTNDNLNYIESNNLDNSIGQSITGKGNGIVTTINIYGLAAGAHLGGTGNLYKFIKENIDVSDNTNILTGGTYISDYIAKFSKIFNDLGY